MADREKVKGHLYEIMAVATNLTYPLYGVVQEHCLAILAMTKEQEPVKPKYNARTNWYECGACHYSMTSGMHCRCELIPAYKVGFCAKCGRGVKWNEVD